MSRKVLLTGATGYVGSHTWSALLGAGYTVIGLDNLRNSTVAVVKRVARIAASEPLLFIEGDVRDGELLSRIFAHHHVDAVVHFAALKSVQDSIAEPLLYYDNNVGGLISLTGAMAAHRVEHLVFSSSATIYGNPDRLPITEDSPLSATNPYGQTKLMGEQILRDLEQSEGKWRIAYLRYFNPVGAHESGLIGEAPTGLPSNLMPLLAQVATGQLVSLNVYGGDYPTPDGTGVRDYIHIMDLAEAHVAALTRLLEGNDSFTANLGTGRGYSVLDVIRAYEKASGRHIDYQIVGRRGGDVAACYADSSRAAAILNWRATRDLDAMCRDSWRWQSQNPKGYSEPGCVVPGISGYRE